MTFKLDDNGCCRIHSVSDDGPPGPTGDPWERVDSYRRQVYVVMPWKVVTSHGKYITLAEAVDGIFSRQESEAKEL